MKTATRRSTVSRILIPIISAIASVSYAGFTPSDFFYYRYSKKTLWHTYHRTVQIPVLDKGESNRWFGLQFASGNLQGLTYLEWPNGKSFIGGILRSSNITYLTNDQKIGSIFYNDPEAPIFGGSSCLQNLTGDDVGNLYMNEPCNKLLVSVQLDINNPSNRTWKKKEINYNAAGIAAIGDGATRKVAVFGDDGIIRLYSSNLDSSQSFKTNDSGWTILKVKSDGKLDSLGRPVIWAYLWNNGFYIQELHLDLITGAIAARRSQLKISPRDTLPLGSTPFENWHDFIPFHVGPNQVRIIAVNYGQLHVFSSDGTWIESPIVSPIDTNFCKPDCRQNPASPLIGYLRVATLNNSKNWQSRQEIMVSDNFDYGGHGLHRLNWVPDGYEDYFALDVQMRETAGNSEPISKPMIRIFNLSPVRQLSNAKLRLWLSREENPKDSLTVDRYYFKDDSTAISTGCSSRNPNLCWIDLQFSDFWSLNPLDSTGVNDIQIGAHFVSWKSWIRSNDVSWREINSSFKSNPNVAIYTDLMQTGDWKLSWGREVDPDSIPLPFGYVQSDTSTPRIDFGPSQILGFENVLGWNSTGAKIQLDSLVFLDGKSSLSINNPEWTSLTSNPFFKKGLFTRLSFQIMQPKPPSNPYWPGQIQASISIPSKGIYNCWLGSMELLNQPEGVWLDFSKPLPLNVTAALFAGPSDVQVSISLNAPAATGKFHLDNLRFRTLPFF